MNEQEQPEPIEAQTQPQGDEEELLRARKRHLGKKLHSRGLIFDDSDHPTDKPVDKDSSGA